MGTSNAYGGSDGDKPLVPSWLPDGGIPQPLPAPTPAQPPVSTIDGPVTGLPPPIPIPSLPPMPPPGDPVRFKAARNNFSRFAASGGLDRTSLGRAASHYVATSTGGSRTAARRMGSSRQAGARLVSFLTSAVVNGPGKALRALRLENLVGRPVEEVFIGMIDYVCPEGGTIDDGIAREAFIETIADLAESGITNFDALTVDQLKVIFELYATHAIEARLCNDIGAQALALPANVADALNVQKQLFDFVRRSVSDALTNALARIQALTPASVTGFVTRVYEQAFAILESMGEAEASAE